MSIVWNLFFLFGGVAVMMIGMKLMGASLEKIAGSGMKKLLSKVTSNRFAGVGVGIGVTCIIQSSTATTVMLVGFVNIGLLTLMQATNVIMGANIGTTITAHIVSLSGVGKVDIGAIAACVGFIGVMISMLSKKQKVSNVGEILTGLGLIFVGLEFISSYAKNLMFLSDGSTPQVWAHSIFAGDHFPLLLILIGIVITALVHSSSTITSLMVVLASIGILPFRNAMFLALGSNIGTCITSIMSSIGTSTNAKRTAMVHLTFNTVGCLIFIAPLWIFSGDITNFFAILSSDVGRQLAIFHTLFNVASTIILLPLTSILVRFVSTIIPEKKKDSEEKFKLSYVDDLMLATPAVAVSRVKLEIVDMSSLAKENLNLTLDMLFNSNTDKQDKVRINEEKLNYLNKAITAYITKLMGKDLSVTDDGKIASYYHVVSDLERVGDYAENIMEYAVKLIEEEVKLSDDAIKELQDMRNKINNLFDLSIKAFNERNLNLLSDVYKVEEEIDDITDTLGDMHIDRLKKGLCNARSGSTYLQTVSNLERVADHIYNVAFSIKKYEKYCEKYSESKKEVKNQ